MLYPDLFLDTIATKNCPIKFYYYQRILLRAMMRYRYFFGTFTRATSKSFLAIMSCYLACMFLPRSKRFVVSEFKKSSLAIVKSKLEEIWTYWPLLKSEVLTQHMSTDYIELIFKNGSVFQILTLGASSRGQRATGGVMEEAALIDGTALAEVIIPMMNIPRMTADGGQNHEEPHSQQIYITSAGSKNTFAYERLIELTTLAVLEPEDYFICGASYELPLRYGLFDKKTIQDQKLSSSFSVPFCGSRIERDATLRAESLRKVISTSTIFSFTEYTGICFSTLASTVPGIICCIFSPQHITLTPLSFTAATILPHLLQIKNFCSI